MHRRWRKLVARWPDRGHNLTVHRIVAIVCLALACSSPTTSSPPAPKPQPAPAPKPEPASPKRTATPNPATSCPDVPATGAHSRAVSGRHRACKSDRDCASVKLDCSHLRCTGINKQHARAYASPIDCRGYSGPMGNYDCDPRFKIEAPRCRAGCCVSERSKNTP